MVAAAADFNGDGLLDIVTIDEFKGVDIYYGQKDKSFSEGISLADAKVIPYALIIADVNGDGKPDIIVGHIEAPSTIFYNDGTEAATLNQFLLAIQKAQYMDLQLLILMKMEYQISLLQNLMVRMFCILEM